MTRTPAAAGSLYTGHGGAWSVPVAPSSGCGNPGAFLIRNRSGKTSGSSPLDRVSERWMTDVEHYVEYPQTRAPELSPENEKPDGPEPEKDSDPPGD